jgi:host factor-I protein
MENRIKESTLRDIQGILLSTLLKNEISVYIYLINGVRLWGVITAFAAEYVCLSEGDRTQRVLKRAISTIKPG